MTRQEHIERIVREILAELRWERPGAERTSVAIQATVCLTSEPMRLSLALNVRRRWRDEIACGGLRVGKTVSRETIC
jgi:hypothetical protein